MEHVLWNKFSMFPFLIKNGLKTLIMEKSLVKNTYNFNGLYIWKSKLGTAHHQWIPCSMNIITRN